jgi:hypothetical protein
LRAKRSNQRLEESSSGGGLLPAVVRDVRDAVDA